MDNYFLALHFPCCLKLKSEILHLQSHFGRLLGILQAPCFSCCFPSKEYDKQDFKYLAQRVPTRKPPDLMFSSKVLQEIL